LNTAKGDKTTITPTEPFQVPLAIPISTYNCNTPTREAEILAVEKLNSYFSCFKCQRKVQTSPDSSIVKCNNCNIVNVFEVVFKRNKNASKTFTL